MPRSTDDCIDGANAREDHRLAPIVTPHRTRGRVREEKWRVFATSRREKRGRAFLRKVGREGIRLYTHTNAQRRRPSAATSLSKTSHVVRPLSHICHGFSSRLINHNRVFSLSIGRVSKCVAALLQLTEASIR